MSDFITGLRGDLVEAAGRLERRGRLGGLRARAWTPAASRGALAVAACGLAVLAAVVFIDKPAPRPGRLHIAAIVHVGGDPAGAALAGGSLWIGDSNGGLVRVDPHARRIAGRVPTGGDVWTVAAGDGGLWFARLANRNFPYNTVTLLRIDPATGGVVARVPTGVSVGAIAVSGGGVWYGDATNGVIRRIGSGARGVPGAIPAQTSALMAATGRTLWSLTSAGTLEAIDAASHRTVERVRHILPVVTSQAIGAMSQLAADATGAWISDPDAGTVIHVDGGGTVRRIAVGPQVDRIAIGAGTVWASYGDALRGRSTVARIDARSGRVMARVDLGGNRPKVLIPDGASVWAVGIDGTAVLISP